MPSCASGFVVRVAVLVAAAVCGLTAVASACTDGSRGDARAPLPASTDRDDLDGHAREVARVASRFLARKPSLRRADCSGLVNDVLRQVGVDPANARGGTRQHWRRALHDGRVVRESLRGDAIRAGDLVFFDRTYDANGNGRVDDALTHIAIALEDVHADGTVVMVHRSSSRIEELRMNLRTPRLHVHPGRNDVVNSPLKTPRYGTMTTPRLTGELYRGHARPPRAAPSATTSSNRTRA